MEVSLADEVARPAVVHSVLLRLGLFETGLLCAYWVVFGTRYPIDDPILANWWGPLFAGASAATLVVSVASLMWRSSIGVVAGARAVAITHVAACAGWFVAWNGERGDDSTAVWLAQMTVIAAIAGAMCWSTSVAVPYTVLVSILGETVRLSCGEPQQGSAAGVTVIANLLLALVLTVVVRVCLQAAALLEETWDEAHTTAAMAATAEAIAVERQRVADVVHDYVLAALIGAARYDYGDQVRHEATQALHRLSHPVERASESTSTMAQAAASITAHATSGGYAVGTSIRLDDPDAALPDIVCDAFAESAREAVRNSRRHAGPHAHITIDILAEDATSFRVEIRDDGPGFHSGAPSSGYGLLRLHQRISELPGTSASVDTHAGTVTTLTWTAGTARAPGSRGEDFRALLNLSPVLANGAAITLVATALACSVAAANSGSELVTYAVSLVIGVGGVAALFIPRSDPLAWSATLTVVATFAAANLLLVLSLTAPIPTTRLWPMLLVGAVATVLGVRGRMVAAIGMTALCSAIPVLVARSGMSWDYWAGQAISEAMGLLLGLFVALTIRPIAHQIRRIRATSTEEYAAVVARTVGAEQRRRRLAAVDQKARPVLDLIATRALTASERHAAANLEARLRATIRAPGLSHEILDHAADNARSRGIHVVLIDDAVSDAFATTSGYERFLHHAANELRSATTQSTVTVRLAPDHHRHRASVVTTHAGKTLRRTYFDHDGAAFEPGTREPATR